MNRCSRSTVHWAMLYGSAEFLSTLQEQLRIDREVTRGMSLVAKINDRAHATLAEAQRLNAETAAIAYESRLSVVENLGLFTAAIAFFFGSVQVPLATAVWRERIALVVALGVALCGFAVIFSVLLRRTPRPSEPGRKS